MLVDDLRRHVDKYYGKYSGEVTENDDSAALGDKQRLGRIQVKVPTIFGEKNPVWARPCLPFGHFFIPEVGTKVWLEFEAGDRRYPIWVGTWYPSGTLPQVADIAPPQSRLIHTPSGHSIQFLDRDEEQKIVISNSEGTVLELVGDTVRVKAQNVKLEASSVELGDGAREPAILGNAFNAIWQKFIQHTHPSAMGPTGTPVPPVVPPDLRAAKALSSVVVIK